MAVRGGREQMKGMGMFFNILAGQYHFVVETGLRTVMPRASIFRGLKSHTTTTIKDQQCDFHQLDRVSIDNIAKPCVYRK